MYVCIYIYLSIIYSTLLFCFFLLIAVFYFFRVVLVMFNKRYSFAYLPDQFLPFPCYLTYKPLLSLVLLFLTLFLLSFFLL